jgi:hypothetical protein
MSIFSENKTEKWKQNNCPTMGEICHKPVQYNPPFFGNFFCFPLQNLCKVVTQEEITLSNSNLPTWMRLIRTTRLLHVTALLRSNKCMPCQQNFSRPQFMKYYFANANLHKSFKLIFFSSYRPWMRERASVAWHIVHSALARTRCHLPSAGGMVCGFKSPQSKQATETDQYVEGRYFFFWGWKQSSHFMCLGIALVKGKVQYIVMPWELRAEPEVQGVNAPIAVSSPAWQPRRSSALSPKWAEVHSC